VATAYRDVLPAPVRGWVRNFFANIADLWIGANNLLQGKPADTVTDWARFAFNTTFGIFGLNDVASDMGLEKHDEDFGQTFGRWGMSETLGPVAVIPRDAIGPFLPGASDASPETQRIVDQEVRRIVTEAQGEVLTLLTENRARLDALAGALLEHETLDEADAYAAAGVTRPTTTLVGDLAAAARSKT